MGKKCPACDAQVTSLEMKCMFCKQLFHMKCVKVSLEEAVMVNKPNKIYWCCDNCNGLINSDILMTILKKLSGLEKSVDQINSKINTSADVPKQDCPSYPMTRSKNVLKRKNSNSDTNAANPVDAPPAKKNAPTGSSINVLNKSFSEVVSNAVADVNVVDSGEAMIVEPTPDEISLPFSVVEDRRWIHASRFNPRTTSDSVVSWLRNKLNIQDIICFPLIARGCNVDELRNISFKIAVPTSLVGIAKERATWPPGVFIRDFVERLASLPEASTT